MNSTTRVTRCLLRAVILLAAVASPSWAAKGPNFMFIIADDCTYRDIGCYGGQAHTPNIDKLATEGMRFENCFQAAPMCSPTRHNVYTGLYPVKSGAYPNHTFVRPGVRSIVHYLKPLGYRVALNGKRHIAPRDAFPFEYGGKQKNPDMAFADTFIGQCARSDTPFCIFQCSNEPHTPWNKGDPSRYDPAKFKLPPYFVDTPETREALSRYMAEITYFDDQVGQSLALLDKHGVADNTLVIVVSEQGSSFPFGKWTCYDTGLQSAFIARWPGKIPAGTVNEAMIEYVDVAPTFIEAAGGSPPAVLDGQSLLPVLTAGKQHHKGFVFGEMTTRGIINGSDYYGIRSIRSGQYKYIWNFTPEVPFQNVCTNTDIFKSWQAKAVTDPCAAELVRRYQHRPEEELYAIGDDPFEIKNLADDPALDQVKQDLRRRLVAWMKSTGDRGQQTELEANNRQTRQRRNARNAPRPNILLMIADDMGLGDTSAYQDFTGNSDTVQVHTPNMDRLSRMGVRFTDAHTPSSRCTPTRYALMTGRYPWRNRLKHWVLFGAQGDPMIEPDRPTLPSMLHDLGYHTAMVGKWHVGLRYRQSDGSPAAGWDDADLKRPLYDTPLDHGFDYCRITSRSHGTSGAWAGTPRNKASQSIGPGHIHGRTAVSFAGPAKKLLDDGPDAYVLDKLGPRHSDHAVAFLQAHLSNEATRDRPFFLYYASNSNHAPYTPADSLGGKPVAGAARSMAGDPMDARADFVYENDVALGRLLSFLEDTDDPRNPGKKLIETTLVIFTSDNGAERKAKSATGPFRSNKGSVYEGGHRVPFIVTWPAGGIGNGDASNPGQTSEVLMGLQDLYATFAELLGMPLPETRFGAKGAEDSISVLSAWRGGILPNRPMFFNDHKEAKADHAACAIRLANPTVDGRDYPGQWKLFFDAGLLRKGRAHPFELYDLATDPQERTNRIDDPKLAPLVAHLSKQALLHRTAGGHRLAEIASDRRVVFDWRAKTGENDGAKRVSLAERFAKQSAKAIQVATELDEDTSIEMTVRAEAPAATFDVTDQGLGLTGGSSPQVDAGQSLLIQFDCDVIVESAEVIAGDGACGGYYRPGPNAPLHIYCVDADQDANDQSGLLSDLGLLKAGQTLRLDSRPLLGVETPGSWRLGSLTVRLPKAAGRN